MLTAFCALACGICCGLTEAWLRRSQRSTESAWQLICNSSECGTYTLDFDSGRLSTTHAWNAMLGYRDEDAPRTRDELLKLIEPADRPGMEEALEAHRAGRADCIECEFRIRRADGRTQWIKCRALIMGWNRRGRPRRMLGFSIDVDSRRRAEELAEMTRFMESTLSSIPSDIAVIDRDGVIILANNVWKRFAGMAGTLGVRPAVGVNYLEVLRSISGADASLAASICEMAAHLLQGRRLEGDAEYQTVTARGPATFAMKLRRFDLPSGPCVAFIHRDITETRATERALRENEQRWKFAIDGSGDAVFDWDIRQNTVHRSAQFFKMLGLSADEGPEDLENLVHPDDLPLVRAKYAGLLAGLQDLCAFEHRLEHRDGSWRWIMARCTVMRRDPDGRAARILGVHTDITALKKVEAQLRAQQAENRMLALVAEHTTNSVIISDGAGLIEWVNRGFETITGYSLTEVIGRKPGAILQGPDSDPVVVDHIRSRIRAGEAVRAKILNYRKDRRPIWIALEVQPVRESSGTISHFVAVMEDVTEAERAEAERRLSQKLQSVGQLASGIAHEINTPIQFVGDSITFLDEAWHNIEPFVKSARVLPPPHADSVDPAAELLNEDVDFLLDNFPIAIARARDGVKRVAGIVRAMKEFAHPDKGEFTGSDINATLQNTLAVASHEYKYFGTATIECGEIPQVRCRISSINQVLLNLIVNAGHALADKQHTKQTGRIDIKSRREGDWVVISVSDNGCGIPEPILERIFDPFFTSKEVGRGTGQGLAIARTIVVEQHGGRLQVQSRLGEGSTFEMWLPVDGPPVTDGSADRERSLRA